MANDRLNEYIRKCLEKGLPRARVMKNLYEAGWSDYEIEDAFDEFPVKGVSPTPQLPRKKLHLKFSGKYIAAAIVLVLVVVSVGLILSRNPGKPAFEEQPKPITVADCGASLQCMIASAEKCSPAKGKANLTLFTAEQTGIDIAKQDELCTIVLRNKAGKEGKCVMKPAEMAGLLQRWKDGIYDDWGDAKCSGTLFERSSNCTLRVSTPFLDLKVGNRSQILVSGYSIEDSVFWSSDKPTIVSVEQGRGKSTFVRGNALGRGKVTARDVSLNCSSFTEIEVR